MLTEGGLSAADVVSGDAQGHTAAQNDPATPANRWWRATATATLPSNTPAAETITVTLTRPALPATLPDVDPEPQAPGRPACFRRLGFRVELIRGTFVRAEVYGEFDMHTAVEQSLQASSSDELLPKPTDEQGNPTDGIVQFLARFRIAEDKSNWDVTAEFRADSADIDGLIKYKKPETGSSTGLNVVGAIATLLPVVAQVPPASPRAGELVGLNLTNAVTGATATAVAGVIGATGVLQTRSLIWHGGALFITNGINDPDDDDSPTSTQVSVMLDIETSFTANLGFISVDPSKPLTARYQAIGVRSSWRSDTGDDGAAQYFPQPVFDPSRGYTLDVPSGALVGVGPVADLLRVVATRISRDNPSYLELEVAMGVDLGILTVDTARVRVRLDAVEAPQLTKLGASLDIPGTLHGRGVVEITAGGFKGSFDLSITPLNIRATASLAVETLNDVTGVLVGVEVEFPVPIILGQSGLGIYGFMGGVGINYARKELPDIPAPALAWLEQQFKGNGVMDTDGWQHQPGALAFAAGMLIGTVDGGFVIHAKGIVLIELPGPRLLLVMKADVLKLPPVLKSSQSASFLAVLDIDFGRGTITIGVVAQYTIEKLLEIRVPVTAFFDTQNPKSWFVDLGNFDEPVTVNVLEVIEGTGYLMIHGNGISGLPAPLPSTHGLTIATGFHISAVLMGSKSIGLYLEVAAGFDAVVSFEPFILGGKIYARGELRLFIISVSASAELAVLVGRHTNGLGEEVDTTYVHGEACGKVSFFFFDIEGCVELTIGEIPSPPPAPADLVAGVVLTGRSPALLEGTAVYHSVDGKLADAVAAGVTDTPPSVPLDAIPVILFDVAPDVASGDVVLGGKARGSTGLSANPWIQRGDFWWQYRVTRVEIDGALSLGKTPATWWTRSLPGDAFNGPALALLDWLPTPTPRAVTYGETLTTNTRERWGVVCAEVAPAAQVLWTFDHKPLGASRHGWTLTGVPLPDPSDTYRSVPVDNQLRVEEPWRSGDYSVDQLHGTDPAVVVGDAVRCPVKADLRPIVSLSALLSDADKGFPSVGYDFDNKTTEALATLLANGTSLADALAAHTANTWQPEETAQTPWCEGRILRSPMGDTDKPAAGRDNEDELVEDFWNRLKYKTPALRSAVRLTQPGGLIRLSVLLMVPRQLKPEQLRFHSLKANGSFISAQALSSGDEISSSNPLPQNMNQPNGPWSDPVLRALFVAALIGGDSKQWGLFHAVIDLPNDVQSLDIGWDRESVDDDAPAFYLIAATGTSKAEQERMLWDDSEIKKERKLLETTLTQDPDDHALLQPGITYTVRVGWKAAVLESKQQPPASEEISWDGIDEKFQEFRFTADSAQNAPSDLTPWLLSTTPAVDELSVLCRQPIRIALATQNVARLFAAYGLELRVQIRSSSGKHPSPPNGSPGQHVVIPLQPGGLLQPIKSELNVMTPWESAVRDIVDQLPCIPSDIDRTHHGVVTIAYDLEPRTDYILDIITAPLDPSSDKATKRIYRLGFTTGFFDSMEELALMVADAPVHHTYIATPAPLINLSVRPSGSEVDEAIQAAGLPVPELPRHPKVEILWNGDAVPQPVAIIIESSEALWRERAMPTKVVDTKSTESPQPEWWVASNTPWMEPQVDADPALAGEPSKATVTSIIRAPGDTRAIVLLASGSRGKQVSIKLVIPKNPLYAALEQSEYLFRAVLDHAPWEEL